MSEAQNLTATILGCASSGGVPRVGGNWGSCDPANPKNRRRRCSLLVSGTNEDAAAQTNVVIDTGCDLREQLLGTGIKNLDAVLYTHEHADHTHGIDDLRGFAIEMKKRVDVYFEPRTGVRLKEAFGYCFTAPPGSPYPPILNAGEVKPFEPISIDGAGGSISFLPLEQQHGSITSLGYRIGNFMYSCDLSDLSDRTQAELEGLDIWVVDALRPVPHPSHFSLEDALHWIDRLKPKRAVLTNLHIDMDYDWVNQNTPDNVVPAFDGMQIDIRTGEILNS